MGDPDDRSVGHRGWRLRQPVIRRCVTLLLAVLTALTLVTGAAAQAAAGAHVVPFEARAADGTALRGDVYLPSWRAGRPTPGASSSICGTGSTRAPTGPSRSGRRRG
ncbi:MAG TPA: hypothetical protein VN748_05070 [Pseudonocardiaceae bacterium]|nr:hypothetical protein [Pseudonocardiaceae bacterium]